ncbi:endonuclease [Mycobacterium phage DS6A]|uniref:GIY-YIG domain-containing protein n=1 Tax=Mycobacterium phage DS6A TaxID=45764 RepID=G8I4G1_9CAUD|nr:endonuclease [Mycobacterium phage DS6A]AER47605.1 hypothetical protein DS6A_51 [Mycobacterium phage DS6A]
MASETFTVYRVYNAAGALLYVGSTIDCAARMYQHARGADWWADAARIELTHCPTREGMFDVERYAIWTERPIHNRTGNQSRRGAPRRDKGAGSVYKAGDRWRAAVSLPGGFGEARKRKTVSAPTRAEAERKLAALRAEIKEGD